MFTQLLTLLDTDAPAVRAALENSESAINDLRTRHSLKWTVLSHRMFRNPNQLVEMLQRKFVRAKPGALRKMLQVLAELERVQTPVG